MGSGSRAWQVGGALVLSAVIGSTGLAFATRSEATADTVRTSMVSQRENDDRTDDDEGEGEHHVVPVRPIGGASQSIVVTVPRIAVFTIDATGRITSAATNTGRAPSVGDTTYVLTADGSYQPGAIDLSGRKWRGDFSRSMKFQRQSGDERSKRPSR